MVSVLTTTTRLFLSQADAASSNEIERLFDIASAGRFQCFNTANSAHGLSAGDQLAPSIQSEIAGADVFISVWSPPAVASPAWMAWELGTAVALQTRVMTVRTLGTSIDDLPLSLSSHFAPDLGNVDQFVAFIVRSE